MSKRDAVVIGASAAGMMGAVSLRRHYPDKSVAVIRNVEKTPVPCGIPYIYGVLKDVDKDIMPDQGFEEMGIEILTKNVEKVDKREKKVIFDDGESLEYEKLLLSPGSKPMVPPLPGVDLKNVYSIKKDPKFLKELQSALEQAQNVVVVGGGFIGAEMAEQIAKMAGAKCQDYFCTYEESGSSKKISVVEMLPHCLMMACEEEFCIEVENELQKMGIELLLNSQVKAIKGSEKAEGVTLQNGDVIPADLVLIGIGAVPNVDLNESLGLEGDPRNGFKVDEYMQTSDPDIYAAGDCASKFSLITNTPAGIRLASVAASEGMIAATNMFSPKKRRTMGALGGFATSVGNRSIGSAGLTSKAAQDNGIEVAIGEAKAPNRHPGSLPGVVSDMKLKLLFRKENGKIIGGHVLGGESVADLINIVGLAIQAELTAEELATMQYATHPLLTASPLTYHVMLAAESAVASGLKSAPGKNAVDKTA